jgi:hypothetical protein
MDNRRLGVSRRSPGRQCQRWVRCDSDAGQALVPYQLALKAPVGSEKVKLTAEAHVVRLEHEGFAVEWREFAPAGIRGLLRAARARF